MQPICTPHSPPPTPQHAFCPLQPPPPPLGPPTNSLLTPLLRHHHTSPVPFTPSQNLTNPAKTQPHHPRSATRDAIFYSLHETASSPTPCVARSGCIRGQGQHSHMQPTPPARVRRRQPAPTRRASSLLADRWFNDWTMPWAAVLPSWGEILTSKKRLAEPGQTCKKRQ